MTILTDLVPNGGFDADAFVMEAPQGYEVKEYLGFGVSPPPALSEGDDAPDWVLSDAEGNKFSLSDMWGKIVVMDFWATWCAPCVAIMPDLQKLHERFTDRDVVVLGISTWESGNPAAFMRKNKFTFQLLIEGDEVAKAYKVSGIPAVYVIGPNGKILYGKVGAGADHDNKLVQIIEKQLEGK